MNIEKNRTKISPPFQYSVSFPSKHPEVVCIIVSIKLHIGKDTDSCHYFCDVLNYSKVTWWNFNYDTITNYSGYPQNVYDDISNKMNKKGDFYYGWIRYNFANVIHKKDILASSTYYFCNLKFINRRWCYNYQELHVDIVTTV